MFNTVNQELSKVASWLKANKLTLHPDKTKYILFHPKKKSVHTDNMNLKIDGYNIERVHQTKFLGIIIHQHLSWTPHIKSITSKISKTIGVISKSRKFLNKSTLLTLYNSLILPYLQYCTLIWGSTYKTHLHSLLLCQKKVARIITHSPPLSHSKPLFLELHILNNHLI